MRVIIALGGNALLRRGEPPSEAVQMRNVKLAAASIAGLVTQHEIVVTHGNGPQIGLLALTSEATPEAPPYGLDVLGAESQGMVGFLLEQALRNELPSRTVATLLTSVLVDASDAAFNRPSKPIGPLYEEVEARHHALTRRWQIGRDGAGYRRVVPSPLPLEILELEAIRLLVDAGVLVICGGGGGVPVIREAGGLLSGVEGVIDKDRTAALLAEALEADCLLLLTDVDAVYTGWGNAGARPLHETSVAELRALDLALGSMAPKAEAACRFFERTGKTAAIGSLADAAAILAGTKGTIITRL